MYIYIYTHIHMYIYLYIYIYIYVYAKTPLRTAQPFHSSTRLVAIFLNVPGRVQTISCTTEDCTNPLMLRNSSEYNVNAPYSTLRIPS